MSGGVQTVRSKDGTEIAFERFGSGPAVILIGGALCDRHARSTGTPLAALLAERFTVYAYDRRGRGASGDTAPYAVQREVEDLEALIREAGGKVALFGLSSGAALGIHAAAQGLAVTRLALFEPPYTRSGDGSGPPDGVHRTFSELIASGRRDDALRFFMRRVVGIPAAVVFVMRLLPMWKGLRALASSLPYDAAVMGDYGLPVALLAKVKVPTVVMSGSKSPKVLQDAVHAVAGAIPGAERRMLEGQNHSAGPEVLAPVLREFFEAG